MKAPALRRTSTHLAAASSVLFAALPLQAQAQSTEGRAKGPAAGLEEIVAVVEAFHDALAAGDSTTALALLADDVVILENGRTEDKEHYRSGHLAGDIRFAQAVERDRSEITVHIVGEVAWAHSTHATRGQMGDREIDAQGAELMILGRVGDGWIIRAIHWSSRSRVQ
jgi:ketosteroid isomerase-like protein